MYYLNGIVDDIVGIVESTGSATRSVESTARQLEKIANQPWGLYLVGAAAVLAAGWVFGAVLQGKIVAREVKKLRLSLIHI